MVLASTVVENAAVSPGRHAIIERPFENQILIELFNWERADSVTIRMSFLAVYKLYLDR